MADQRAGTEREREREREREKVCVCVCMRGARGCEIGAEPKLEDMGQRKLHASCSCGLMDKAPPF